MASIEKREKIAIIGSGLIGQSWAMIFASSGLQVTVFDIEPSQVEKALTNIKETLNRYESQGCIRGTLPASYQSALIRGASNLLEALKGATYVQECVPESVELKQKVFSQLSDHVSGDDVIMASSSSCLPVSKTAPDIKRRDQALVAHPVNPPYFIPLVEIVPGPFTRPELVTRTRALMELVGQAPVTLAREAPGFALNRIQYAIINEAWSMYKSGLLSATDVDRVMTDGLGPRYAWIGPLETMHLNADGVVDYCRRYAQGGYDVSSTLTPPPVRWDVDTAEKVQNEMSGVAGVPERRRWRDGRLAALANLKRQLKEKTD